MKPKLAILLIAFAACSAPKKLQTDDGKNYFPVAVEKPSTLPGKENFYIYIMAGQSNMAGRGFVQPQDTIISKQVLALDKNNEWVYAKEPLHYYEPVRTGLDCGLSFGKKLASSYGKHITIGLIPCAIGGSSIEQWLYDSTHHGVKLYSNLMNKVKAAAPYGIIKGIIWHQGESNSGRFSYRNYKQKLETLFTKIRKDLSAPELPVYMGEISSFLKRTTNSKADSVNRDMYLLSAEMKNMYVIKTGDLTPKADTIHFDSRSQRIMGERFATKVFNTR